MSVKDPCAVKTPVTPRPALELETLASGLEAPVYLTHAGDGSGRIFVVEQAGTVRVIERGKLLPTPFLDLRDQVESGGEKGLLSLAFHPTFQANRKFYIDYTSRQSGKLRTIIAEYLASAADLNVADPASARVLLTIDQPFDNHKGGLLLFGPDGYLYIGSGDGGSEGDPLENGQNRSSLLGKLLRIDVTGSTPYGIPADNPFVGQAGIRGEIWAYGLRNPWRFSFDRCTGRLFVADVGQDRYEEVDLIVKGGNYGWNTMEGAHCFHPPSGCGHAGLELPIAEYDHTRGCSITGGYVYRGMRYPTLIGHYLFGDFCSGRIWSLVQNTAGQWIKIELIQTQFAISSFGEDEAGDLYMLDYYGGALHHIKSR